MMGRKRKHRKDLPQRVVFNHNAYYFISKDGWIWLGKTMPAMLAQYAKIIERPVSGRMSEIMDRYLTEWAPLNKRPRTVQNNEKEIVPLKAFFGHMEPHEIVPTYIYQYMDERPAIAANRETALLSSVFKFAIRKGLASENPCRFVSRNPEKPRDRHVEDEEYQAVYSIAPPIIQCAMELARQTGLRLGDLLRLNELENVREEGLHVVTGKTGKVLLFTWTDELRAAVEKCKALRKVRSLQRHLLCNRDGQRYTVFGFSTLWQRVRNRAECKRFQFRDIRAIAAHQSSNATDLLGHNDPKVTNRVYKRGPRKVTPNK